jgi:hypothetical protein
MISTTFDRHCFTVLGRPVDYRRLTIEERTAKRANGATEFTPWGYIGRVDGGSLELWKDNGRWREDDSAHPLDLAVVMGK